MPVPSHAPTPVVATHQMFEVGVKALIVRDGRLLLLKRRDYHKWEMPGGRINTGESIDQALRRELAEELPDASGQYVVQNIRYAHQANFTLPNGRRLLLLFFSVKMSSSSKITTFSSEHEAITWASAEMLCRMDVQPHVLKAGLLALSHKP